VSFGNANQADFSKRYGVSRQQTSDTFLKLLAKKLVRVSGYSAPRSKKMSSFKFYNLTDRGETLVCEILSPE
jgi:hypothetical protein